jgi:hypothetical protein
VAKYTVTGAMAQVMSRAQDGTPVLVYRYRGDVVELSSQQAEHLVDVGLVTKAADVDSDPVVNPAAGLVGVTPGQPSGGRPADDADHAEWVAYAVSRGLAESDAQLADRDDLVAIYSDDVAATEPTPVDPPKPPAKPASK